MASSLSWLWATGLSLTPFFWWKGTEKADTFPLQRNTPETPRRCKRVGGVFSAGQGEVWMHSCWSVPFLLKSLQPAVLLCLPFSWFFLRSAVLAGRCTVVPTGWGSAGILNTLPLLAIRLHGAWGCSFNPATWEPGDIWKLERAYLMWCTYCWDHCPLRLCGPASGPDRFSRPCVTLLDPQGQALVIEKSLVQFPAHFSVYLGVELSSSIDIP